MELATGDHLETRSRTASGGMSGSAACLIWNMVRRRVRRRPLALGLALALASPVTVFAQQHFPDTEDVEVMLRYLVEDGETPGIVLGFLEADGATRVVSYGDAGDGARPLGPRSVFEIGSITKTFTATLLADMVARGEMALDDPASKYLPAWVEVPTWEGREITLADLATHHSGLPRMPDNFAPGDPKNPYGDYTADQLYEFLSSHELRRAPGAEYEYSNVAVGLLGHILERATGQSYEQLVRERILDPLGMDMTGITRQGELLDWMTRGHDGAGEVVPYWDVSTTAFAGAGALRSNAEDMLEYLAAQVGPPESDIERAMRATHRVRVEMDEEAAGGLGWGVRRFGGRRVLRHGGATAGYSTMVGFDPDLRVGVVMLTNTGDFDDDIAADFLRRGRPLDIPEARVPEAVLESYVGSYEMAPGRAFVVRLEEDGGLTVQAPGNVRFRMYAASDTSFFLKRTPWQFTFGRDEAGEVIGMVADLEGSRQEATKVSTGSPPPAVVAGNATVEVPLAPEEMTRYEGMYVLRMGEGLMDVRVFAEGDRLMAQPAGNRPTVLHYQGGHAFVTAVDPDIRLVFAVEDGRAEQLTLQQGGRSTTGVREGSTAEPEPPVRDLPLDGAGMARYEGTYVLEVGPGTLDLRIFGENGRLISQAAGQQRAPLRYQGDHVFVPDFDDSVRLTFDIEDGRATSVTLHQGGGTFTGRRKP